MPEGSATSGANHGAPPGANPGAQHERPRRSSGVLRAIGLTLAVISLLVGGAAMVRTFRTGVNDAYIPLHFLSMLPASAERWLIDASAAPGMGRLLAWALDVPLYVYSGFLGILLLITNPSGPRRRR